MTFRRLKPWLSGFLLVITVGLFVYYFAKHPSIGHDLSKVSLGVVALLLMLYAGTIAALALMTLASLNICRVKLDKSESLLLTAYTAVINFFGPLQSGPAFRAVYLKQKHGLKLKDYTFVTLLYLGFFGLFSVAFLFSGVLGWWLVLIALTATATSYFLSNKFLRAFNRRAIVVLALATFLQIAIVSLIYYTELHSVAPGISYHQAVIYTGAADLALYVSLTPGAIGFRESFLLLSHRLHHISSSTVLAASALDRAMYIVLLALLAAFIFGTHLQKRLTPKAE